MSRSLTDGASDMVPLTDETFEEALRAAQGLVMVDFWAPWCSPCRAIAPILEEVASAGRVTLMTVNVDEHPRLAARYDIRSIPTILFVKQGEVGDRVVGAAPKGVPVSTMFRRAANEIGALSLSIRGD